MLAQLNRMDWVAQVKNVLKNWYEAEKLDQNPLAQLTTVSRLANSPIYSNDPNRRAKALREIFRRAFEHLCIENERPPDPDHPGDPKWVDRRWRYYNILTLSIDLPAGEVASRIGLALGGQYYRDQAKGIELLAEILRQPEGSPIEGASQAVLAYPSGAVKLNDPFYIKREADGNLANGLGGSGETITIRGARQTGKTSLLVRGMHQAQHLHNARIVYFDLQEVDEEALNSLDDFLRVLADWIADELDLDPAVVGTSWESRLPGPRKLTKFIERHVLSAEDGAVLLALDEIDRLQLTDFHSDFFGLVRSWHNRRAHDDRWNRLSVIMAISTEPYLLIDDLHQSPFNVGLVLYLDDFSQEQVSDLGQRYGLSLSDSEVSHVMRFLHGQPFLTRVAFYTMTAEDLTWSELEEIACDEHGPFHQHLEPLYRLATADPALRQALQEILISGTAGDDVASLRLEKAGIVRAKNGGHVPRCELYRRYFGERL